RLVARMFTSFVGRARSISTFSLYNREDSFQSKSMRMFISPLPTNYKDTPPHQQTSPYSSTSKARTYQSSPPTPPFAQPPDSSQPPPDVGHAECRADAA